MAGNGHDRVELVSDIIARHADQWIFFEVVEEDEYERPSKGRLIAHHSDREGLHRLIMAFRRNGGRFGVRYTGRIIPEGELILL